MHRLHSVEHGYWKGPTWLDQVCLFWSDAAVCVWAACVCVCMMCVCVACRVAYFVRLFRVQTKPGFEQVWFAYTGLMHYSEAASDPSFAALAKLVKHRTLTVGQGFGPNDRVPLNEHCAARPPAVPPHHSLALLSSLLFCFAGVKCIIEDPEVPFSRFADDAQTGQPLGAKQFR